MNRKDILVAVTTKHYKVMMSLRNVPLFINLSQEDFLSALERLKAKRETVPRGNFVFPEGKSGDEFAVLLSGSVSVEEYSLKEERIFLFTLDPGDLLIDPAILDGKEWAFRFRALQDSVVLRMDMNAIREPRNRKDWILSENVGRGLAKNFRKLNQKVLHVSLPSIRSKILEFLKACAKHYPVTDGYFEIPLDRAAMAAYLNTDRSALSKELGKLAREGIIEFDKNRFRFVDFQYPKAER